MDRTRKTLLFLVACSFVAFIAPAVNACSVFALPSNGGTVYGQNLDWREWFPGHVLVNVRGVEKAILDWEGHWPTTSARKTITWTSRFGSVTFTCYGRDFIDGGMNEVGLIVDETNFDAGYPPDDDRPGISCTQWMQYQLDNFATVDEVLTHLGDLRPDGEGWHYLIADAGGECAVIEYANGNPVVYKGEDLPYRAISNTSYRQGLSHIPMDKAFGGEIDIASGDDAYGRFIRMAILLDSFDDTLESPAAGYAFTILDKVGSELTRRSVVYDGPALRVLWRTESNPAVRWLDLGSLDFSAGQPTRVVDIEVMGPGDVAGMLEEYTAEGNLKLVKGVLGLKASEEVRALLATRGLTYDQVLEMIALHPTRDPALTVLE